MRVPRLFVPCTLHAGGAVQLSAGPSHKLAHVLRGKVGDRVSLFDGQTGLWDGEILRVASLSTVRAIRRSQELAEDPARDGPTIAFAPLKPERTRALIEKCTELGASAFLPLATQQGAHTRELGPGEMLDASATSSVAALAATRTPAFAFDWAGASKAEGWAVEASEQCGRLSVPAVLPTVSTVELLLALLGRGLAASSATSPVAAELASVRDALSALPARGLDGRRSGHSARMPPTPHSLLAGQHLSTLLGGAGPRLLLVADEAGAAVRGGEGAATVAEAVLEATGGGVPLPEIVVMVGPEAGWSPLEAAAIRAAEAFSLASLRGGADAGSVRRVRLAPCVLRSETAAASALAQLLMARGM
jgi:16S rRNA U1498 N3-methylase RsmE